MSGSAEPVARLVVAGAVTTAITVLELEQNADRRAGTFRATVPLDIDDPVVAVLLASNAAASGPPSLSIDLGWQLAGAVAVWQTMLVGRVDQLSVDVARGLLAIEGRDGVGQLIDTAVTQGFQNQTSAEIVSQLAAAAGLAANVVETSTFSGQFYQIDHARSALNGLARFVTAWDLVCELAAFENYACWISGQTLNFVPAGTFTGQQLSLDVAALLPGAGGALGLTSLRFDRRLAIDTGLSVTVRSWNSRQKTVVQQSCGTAATDNATMVFVTPNATDQTALAKASALFRDIARHRRVASGDMAGDLVLAPNDALSITNSPGGAWDGSYVVDVVTRRISVRHGFEQSFVARFLAD